MPPRRLLAALLSFFVLPLPAQTPEPAPITTLHTQARIVVLDVIVTDAHGKPVRNLKQDAFHLLEDGKPQTIVSFTEHDASATPAIAVAPSLPPNTFAPRVSETGNGAMTVIVLGNLGINARGEAGGVASVNDVLGGGASFEIQQLGNDAPFVRSQIKAFLKSGPPATPIAIFRLDWQGLHLIQSFTSDPAVLRAAVTSKRVLPPLLVPGTVPEDLFDRSSADGRDIRRPLFFYPSFRTTGDPIRQLASYLSGVPGRINLLWFGGSPDIGHGRKSDPFPDIDTFLDDANGPKSALHLSRVALYPVVASGLSVTPGFVPGEPQMTDGHPGTFLNMNLAEQAESTGGKAFYDTNGFKEAIAEVVDSGSHYYTLSYTPTNADWNDGYRRIKLNVDTGEAESGLDQFFDWLNAETRIEYKRGYFATDAPFAPAVARRSADADGDGDSTQRRISYSPKGDPAPNKSSPRSFQAAMKFGMLTPTQLGFTATVTPSSEVVHPAPGAPLPKDNFLTEPWHSSPYRTLNLHYTLNLADLKLAITADSIRDELQFVTVIYRDDGALVNSLASTIHLDLDTGQAATFAQEGVTVDQAIAIPAEGNFFLRAGVHETGSNRTGVIEIPSEDIQVPQPAGRGGTKH